MSDNHGMIRALFILVIIIIVFVTLSLIVAVFASGLSKNNLERSLKASVQAVIYGFAVSLAAIIPVAVLTSRTEQTLAILFPIFLLTGFITIIIKLGISKTRFLLLIPALLLFREALLNLGISKLVTNGHYFEYWSLYSLGYHF